MEVKTMGSFTIVETRSRRIKKIGTLDFVAIDGEGFTDMDGRHHYVLLAIGQAQIENENGLEFEEIFEFLYDYFKKQKGGIAYVGYFLAYDFNQWFKNLPEERARWLYVNRPLRCSKCHGKLSVRNNRYTCTKCRRREPCQKNLESEIPGRPPHLLEYKGWQFSILAGKRLRLRPKMCNCEYASCPCPKAPEMYICDAGGFFQQKFTATIARKGWAEPVINEVEETLISIGKDRRSVAVLDDDMRMYNRLENDVLERVMRVLNAGYQRLGIYLSPREWFGPGQPAGKWLKDRTPTHAELFGQKELTYTNKKTGERKIIKPYMPRIVPKYFELTARASYFGGWFEIFCHGPIVFEHQNIRVTYENDINNAYPYAIANLPCLQHGTYSKGTGMPNVNGEFVNGLWKGDFCLVKARVKTPIQNENYSYIGAMLHRDHRSKIHRPLMTEGWYWWHELQAGIKANMLEITHSFEWTKYVPCACPPPLREVQELYDERLKEKAKHGGKDTSYSRAIKYLCVSLYGKNAQSVGFPAFGNPVYASLITSACRTMITLAIASHPRGVRDVAMIATDGIYFISEHGNLPITNKLGDWSNDPLKNLVIFKPGVYWHADSKEELKFKARGIEARQFGLHLDEIEKRFLSWGEHPPNPDILNETNWPSVRYTPSFAMITGLQALMMNDWTLAGTIKENAETTQTSDPHDKRQSTYWDYEDQVYRTQPYEYGWNVLYKIMQLFVDKTLSPEDLPIINDLLDSLIEDGTLSIASIQYKKMFGSEDPYSQETREANGIAWDEYVSEAGVFDIARGR
jgi:hypothetical protein